jgi:hypothetical protein
MTNDLFDTIEQRIHCNDRLLLAIKLFHNDVINASLLDSEIHEEF